MRVLSFMILVTVALLLVSCPKEEPAVDVNTTVETMGSQTETETMTTAETEVVEVPASDMGAEVTALVGEIEHHLGEWEAKLGTTATPEETAELTGLKAQFAALKTSAETTIASWNAAPAEGKAVIETALGEVKTQLEALDATVHGKLGDASHSEGGETAEGSEGGEAAEGAEGAEGTEGSADAGGENPCAGGENPCGGH